MFGGAELPEALIRAYSQARRLVIRAGNDRDLADRAISYVGPRLKEPATRALQARRDGRRAADARRRAHSNEEGRTRRGTARRWARFRSAGLHHRSYTRCDHRDSHDEGDEHRRRRERTSSRSLASPTHQGMIKWGANGSVGRPRERCEGIPVAERQYRDPERVERTAAACIFFKPEGGRGRNRRIRRSHVRMASRGRCGSMRVIDAVPRTSTKTSGR